MNTTTVVKCVAKGLAMGVLWPTAAGYVVGKRASKWIGNLAHESLDTAMEWETAAESGIKEARLAAEFRWGKKPSVSVQVEKVNAARSVGAASADDPNVTGAKKNYDEFWDSTTTRIKALVGEDAGILSIVVFAWALIILAGVGHGVQLPALFCGVLAVYMIASEVRRYYVLKKLAPEAVKLIMQT